MTAEVVYESHVELERRRKHYPPTGCEGQMIVQSSQSPIWELECNKCGFEVGIPARDADPRIRRQMQIDRAGLPAQFARKAFEQNPNTADVLAQLRLWIGNFRHAPLPAPAIYGEPGRGKTHLLVALCRQLIVRRNVQPWFRSAARLLDDLQQSFDNSTEHAALWDRAITVPVLALDDLGAEQATDWRADRLARLVDERYQAQLPIIVATNYRPDTWDRTVGERTVSRLHGMTFPLELTGEDRRQNVQDEIQAETAA